MKIPLFDFQERALRELRDNAAFAIKEWQTLRRQRQQVLSLTAPTGAGKTIVMAALIEDILFGSEYYPEQPEAVFVWLSDSPQLNEQSHMKILTRSDRILPGQLCTIDEGFDCETLADGCIYFLNTQKLGKNSRITRAGDRNYTIWQTLANTVREKSDRLYIIIDEAHRGMLGGNQMKEATTIMQKFLKGSAEDGLPAMPLVIGMSATSERFDKLVTGIASTTVRRTAILADDVRASGLLKERIFVHYPASGALETSMGMLHTAAVDWQDKCQRWRSYCEAQDEKPVAPVLIVQVEPGGKGNASDTPLDECLRTIEGATGERFARGQVVHAFGEKAVLNLGGLEVPYEEPAAIDGNDAVRVVLFKESLTTGWDCPRAETMMSFRRAKDATYIAQLLGRMIRTPLARRIEVDETLDNVNLFLPHFEKATVDDIVKALREGGGYGGEVESGSTYETLTVTPSVGNDAFDRAAVLRFINEAGARTYQVRSMKIKSYLSSLFGLAHVLTQSSLYLSAVDDMQSHVVEMLREHVSELKKSGEYDALAEKVRKVGLVTVGVDISGGIDGSANMQEEQARGEEQQPDLFGTVGVDIARQFRISNKKLAGEGIGEAYGRMLCKEHDPNDDEQTWMVDTIIFAADECCMRSLHNWAEKKFRSLQDEYRQKIARYTGRDAENVRRQYDKIVMDGDPVSQHSLRLPERVQMPCNEDDKDGDPMHLFVGEESGVARIKLGSWEAGVVAEEEKRADFVCWIRNPARAAWALCIPYKDGTTDKPMYPDLIIVRHDAAGYVLDILEPHGGQFADNLAKAHALAEYARLGRPCVGRVQLIREMKNEVSRKSQFRRLDMGKSQVRDAVLKATSNDALDKLFDEYGTVE